MECSQRHRSCSLVKHKRELEDGSPRGGERKKRPRPVVEIPVAGSSLGPRTGNAAIVEALREIAQHLAQIAEVAEEFRNMRN